jgi:hypothetical protein
MAGGLLYLVLGYGGTGKNGNLLSESIASASGVNVSQPLTYDPVNRLKTAAKGSGWRQVYVYRRLRNRTVLGGSQYCIPGESWTPQAAASAEVIDKFAATNSGQRNCHH